MNVFMFFADSILPYFAVPVFVIGVIWRWRRWVSIPLPMRIGLAPSPKTAWAQMTGMVAELVFLRTLYSSQRILWFLLVPFQALFGLFMLDYALRFVYGVILVHWQIDPIPAIETILSILRFSGLGLVIITLLMFAHRLGKVEVRRISIPSDYAVLGLILALSSLASFNNFVDPTPIAYIGRWIIGLVTFAPAPIGHLAFSVHILALQIMLIVFSFSKMRDPLGHQLSRMFTVKEELLHPDGVVVK